MGEFGLTAPKHRAKTGRATMIETWPMWGAAPTRREREAGEPQGMSLRSPLLREPARVRW